MRYLQFLSGLGNPSDYSPGLQCLTTCYDLRSRKQRLELEDLSNAKTLIREKETGKWFIQIGSMEHPEKTMMLGAVCGDIAGSAYEWNNIKQILSEQELIENMGRPTDDSVMTLAVAEGIRLGIGKAGEGWLRDPGKENIILREIQDSLIRFGRTYPGAGYGGSFRRWLRAINPQPYNSWGNGSAMRVSYAGWCANSLAEAERLAELSACVTHNHPEGIKGAKSVAGIIYLLRKGKDKAEIRRYAEQYYDLNFTLEEIRPEYRFDVSCMGSVPQAIRAFLEGEDFAQVIALAISIGGDSDTIAAIAGSMAEVIYPMSQKLRYSVATRLDPFLRNAYREAADFAFRYQRVWDES